MNAPHPLVLVLVLVLVRVRVRVAFLVETTPAKSPFHEAGTRTSAHLEDAP